jgi:hypothetical protein
MVLLPELTIPVDSLRRLAVGQRRELSTAVQTME